ncbi:cell envelope integrity EipB family protein [Allorhizobium sp. BGMRC 0089]|uniref:cell envelope integrity EipB family protein n=1 Tax=Allorhizobium sonneratiae TaxID=2934936 RepID=UPI0020347F4F|nr:cell envelope integrity EipB family protein [Allorhizobium sonneratiae]MCM2293619.1 cell envelope integrity EipB family protein [Allorhizobium sonneratiae]
MAQASLALVMALTASTIVTPGREAAQAIRLQPHRAVYDVTLKKATDQSGVEDMSGRMVYEFSGSACAGYTTNFRFVTKVDTGDQVNITDQQIRTFENVLAHRFDFETKSYTDDKIDRNIKGAAVIGAQGLKVDLLEPQKKQLTLAAARFPTEHMIDLLRKAESGGHLFQARVFDGTEDGDKSYLTTTVIGPAGRSGKKGELLPDHRYYPVSIAYYDDSVSGGDQVPSYTQTFDLYDNGVTRNLTLDYGDIVLTGKLSKLDLLPEPACDQQQ